MSQIDPILGDLSRLDEMRSNAVKGNLMNSRIWYVRDRYGDKELRHIADKALAARAMIDKPPLPFIWCSFGDMIDFDKAILEGPMHGDFDKMREFGGAIAKHDLPTLYKVLFKVGTPRFLLKRVGIVAATYIRDSPMKGDDIPDGGVRVVQTGTTLPYYFCAFGVCGWFQAALELSGGKNCRVVHSSCRHRGAESCAWDAHWD